MVEIVLAVALVLALAVIVVLALRRRPAQENPGELRARLDAIDRSFERIERTLREEAGRTREESAAAGRGLREEVAGNIKEQTVAVLGQITTFGEMQAKQLERFSGDLHGFRQGIDTRLEAVRAGLAESLSKFTAANDTALKSTSETLIKGVGEIGSLQKTQLETFAGRITQLTEAVEKRLESLRGVVDQRLKEVQEQNAKKLDEMRATVDEKLQGTLEKRLGESFKLVTQQLEQVHQGLGEMKNLATGVGDLKRVLSNVSTRGTWGELRLQSILEQILAPEQYDADVTTKPGTLERVEFAIKLPGRAEGDAPVWLPIDSKFPKEDYERLQQAQEQGDADAVEQARASLDRAVSLNAGTICEKYLNPPLTTDFAIMFLPTEGLYAEVVRRPALLEQIQRKCRVIVAGPTTLAALLNSLQMGFRTLAIQKRSSEVWSLLGAIKLEFGKYGDVLAKVQKKLHEASNTIELAETRTRVINRKLKNVEELPAAQVKGLLGSDATGGAVATGSVEQLALAGDEEADE